ncbi:MAG: ABC transporter transmembrane domain-containing protein [Candidatus Rokuibacteriota bacterium]
MKGAAQFAQFYWLATTSQRVVAGLRLDLVRHVIGLSPSHFTARHSGEVMSHFAADLSGVAPVSFRRVRLARRRRPRSWRRRRACRS